MSCKYTGRQIHVAEGEEGEKKILQAVATSETSRKEGKIPENMT